MSIGTAKLVSDVMYNKYGREQAANVYQLIPNWRPTQKHTNGYKYLAVSNNGYGRVVHPVDSAFRSIEWETPFDDETALAVLGYTLEQNT